jgi:hypothetical protein
MLKASPCQCPPWVAETHLAVGVSGRDKKREQACLEQACRSKDKDPDPSTPHNPSHALQACKQVLPRSHRQRNRYRKSTA